MPLRFTGLSGWCLSCHPKAMITALRPTVKSVCSAMCSYCSEAQYVERYLWSCQQFPNLNSGSTSGKLYLIKRGMGKRERSRTSTPWGAGISIQVQSFSVVAVEPGYVLCPPELQLKFQSSTATIGFCYSCHGNSWISLHLSYISRLFLNKDCKMYPYGIFLISIHLFPVASYEYFFLP